jgi:hypothetical protein
VSLYQDLRLVYLFHTLPLLRVHDAARLTEPVESEKDRSYKSPSMLSSCFS